MSPNNARNRYAPYEDCGRMCFHCLSTLTLRFGGTGVDGGLKPTSRTGGSIGCEIHDGRSQWTPRGPLSIERPITDF